MEKGAVCEEEPARVKSIKGWEHLDEVVMVDQSPIVRTPVSYTHLDVYKRQARVSGVSGWGQDRW